MIPPINVDRMVEFLVGLLNTPSPTGDTDRAIAYVQQAFAELPLAMQVSPKGFLTGTWTGSSHDAPRALTAHVDTLGAMVREVKENGRLRLTQLGGWSWTSVEGEGVTIFTAGGQTYRGAILPTTASVHAHTREERSATRTDTNTEVRIDAITSSREETQALGIQVGDIVAFDPRVELNDNGFIRSRHLDDKACVATIYAALLALVDAGLEPKQTTTIHISNYEEVGHGAATGFPPDLVDLLTVDMAVVAPAQQSDEHSVTICAKDSAGPYHLGFRRELEALAQANQIPYKVDVYPFYGSDGEAYWQAGGNVRVGLIGPGVDASHHYERTHRDALQYTAQLIAAYLLS
ncbi:MAG: M42 family metallopeptidase [Ardenticatenaceae bacterium]|nr:M42 family metallopeptidase [Anaerolineales bacterium]MCB8982344.1 M42 family metallopeptidase [Ardenticatenaceae bacterium]